MYRCSVCDKTSKPRQGLLRYVIYRDVPCRAVVGGEAVETTRKEIAREIPVCEGCLKHLSTGAPLAVLSRQRGKVITVAAPAVPAPIIPTSYNKPVQF